MLVTGKPAMEQEATVLSGIDEAAQSLKPSSPIPGSRYQKLIEQSRNLPRPSEARIRASLSDEVVDISQLQNDARKQQQTYLYLGYGSNMCALSFLVRRKIKPLAQVNVVVPDLALTFDLPGVPYSEPCFGNVRWRDPDPALQPVPQEKPCAATHRIDYHKNRWHKGLVGVVYEVTAADFAHILATEGGGAAYKNVLVDCYSLSDDPDEPVPSHPTGQKLRVNTLFSPEGRTSRPDSSYAQPSARYLKLLTDGGQEHNLPTEYRAYLDQIRTYTKSTTQQRLGAFIFLAVWGPVLAFFFKGAGKIFLRPDGTFPAWYAKMALAIFSGLWNSYDSWFKPLFGDGERTVADGGSTPGKGKKGGMGRASNRVHGEKMPLLGAGRDKQMWSEPGTSGGDEMV